jgi:hypothetical protein
MSCMLGYSSDPCARTCHEKKLAKELLGLQSGAT